MQSPLDKQPLELRNPRRRFDITLHDETAALTGTVQSWAEEDAALSLVRHTPGVQRVEQQLCVLRQARPQRRAE
jgi:osmotically-inducible protein OsmY